MDKRKLPEEEKLRRFNEVKALMLKGWPLYKACKKLGIVSSALYRIFTVEQKRELSEIKVSHASGRVPVLHEGRSSAFRGNLKTNPFSEIDFVGSEDNDND